MPSIVNRNASICRCGCGHKIDIETNRDVKFSAPNDHEFQGSTVNPCGEDFMMIKMPEGQLRYFTRALLVLGRPLPEKHQFRIGVWVEVSAQAYMRCLMGGGRDAGASFEGTLANHLHPCLHVDGSYGAEITCKTYEDWQKPQVIGCNNHQIIELMMSTDGITESQRRQIVSTAFGL